MIKELFFSDEAKIKGENIFSPYDVSGVWVAEDPLLLDIEGCNIEFIAIEKTTGKKAHWYVILENEYPGQFVLNEAKCADEVFNLAWEAWLYEYL